MTTVRQIQRTWSAKQYDRLFRDLAGCRSEAAFPRCVDPAKPVPAAALAMIRLDELGHAHVPLYTELTHTLIGTQQQDGGWSDPANTALCLRALLAGNGHGVSIDRGITYLANLQRPEGIWPAEPIRRMPADATASAFILYQLGHCARFRAAVRFDAALAWFDQHQVSLDRLTQDLWHLASLRCRRFIPGAVASVWC